MPSKSSKRSPAARGLGLKAYKAKRRFDKTPEPPPKRKHSETRRLFVVQKHRASHLHYDFRLEADGVLKSWAVPKGPSLSPGEKRLAMEVEDHPVDYADFEGVITEGEYGGGTVMVWDTGTYEMEGDTDDVTRAIEKGELKFTLHGKKLKGSWVLVRTRDRQWLLIKHRDKFATDDSVTEDKFKSVLSGRTLAKIAKDEGGDEEKAATGDPEGAKGTRRRRPAKKGPPSRWISNRHKPTTKTTKFPRAAKMPPEAKKKAMPRVVQPMLATLVDEPFSDPEWIFETKWDGVRTICYIRDGKYRLASRRKDDVTAKYPELSDIANAVRGKQVILDGEIVALDKEGIPRFELLQPRFGLKPVAGKSREETEATIAYYVFDIMYLDGYDLTGATLLERKVVLQQIIKDDEVVRYSDHIAEEGENFFKQIRKLKLEGMMAKRAESKYIQRRSKDWLKVKALQSSEVVIGGYTKPRNSREHLGALVVGLYDGDRLEYVGHVGGGFNRASLKQVYDLLHPLEIKRSPFATPVKTNERPIWVKPSLVCEVRFSEWTSSMKMRQPVFLGLRDDKKPRECVIEKEAPTKAVVKGNEKSTSSTKSRKRTDGSKVSRMPASKLLSAKLEGDLAVTAPGGTVKLTNLHKVYWPRDKYTKGDLLAYYFEISKYVLPYLKDRPLILKRYPDGIDKPAFHQHSIPDPPPFVQRFERESDGDLVSHVICDNVASLLYVANLGTITLHPWSARRQTPMKPDWVLFDLDPGQASFEQVLKVALLLREDLAAIGLECYPKTSGSSGVHLYVPIRNDYTHEQVVDFATIAARLTASKHPDLISVERMVKKRAKGTVYLDYLQNGYGKSLAGPYSVRARDGATVSTPLEWKEVERGKVRPQDFTIKNIMARIKKVGDLFKPALSKKQSLAKAVQIMDRGGE